MHPVYHMRNDFLKCILILKISLWRELLPVVMIHVCKVKKSMHYYVNEEYASPHHAVLTSESEDEGIQKSLYFMQFSNVILNSNILFVI